MKLTTNFKTAVIIGLLIAVTGVSCKKDKKTTTKTGAGAEVTASNFGFDGTGGAAFKSTAAGIVRAAGVLTITAIKDGTNQSISIVLFNATAAGTFSLDATNTDGNGAIITKDYTKPADNTLNYSTSNDDGHGVIGGGQVKITSISDTAVEGTFYIVAYNSLGKAAFAEQGTFKGTINK